jgi:hypothetical protein
MRLEYDECYQAYGLFGYNIVQLSFVSFCDIPYLCMAAA